ncbi:MAG: hypothetical protein CMH61_02250 [Nanoarchaeota archaeon]|nr:hypothetical protein [Nanoarchaeota archaeon]|tara:strand:+ start:3429 stop:3944 length:516 start_codon:yes stop_codon:yes gene_type:complete
MDELGGQPCPICNEKTLTLREEEMEVPHFGHVFMFSMSCSSCNYHKGDIEPAQPKEPAKYTLEVSSEDDLNIRIVKSGNASIKIPHVITQDPGPASEGYITNVEGLIEKVKAIIQAAAESEDEKSDRKKAKNLIKKLNKVIFGKEKLKIIIEDPTGNSAIISDKAVKSKLK